MRVGDDAEKHVDRIVGLAVLAELAELRLVCSFEEGRQVVLSGDPQSEGLGTRVRVWRPALRVRRGGAASAGDQRYEREEAGALL